MADSINADFTQRVVLDTTKMDWQTSPSATVWRKRLDLIDGEHSRVTSIVRYDRKSSFPPHEHPEGEEILVLDGTFADEHGEYPAGTYLLNPPGSRHAPESRRGCVLFVKLRQYGGPRREHVVVDTRSAKMKPGPVPGVDVLTLYANGVYPETMELLHFAAGASLPHRECPGGLELFVIEGDIADDQGRYHAGTWLRLPHGSDCSLRSRKGATLYVKRGHLPQG
jgi:anti-sigma factor ChrR (cupin superfamily)